ncbi:sulfide/dihydroorotate dehydrogenase-like FAD/NAD-binding protein [Serpentinicella alkaliphila]|uniref:NAD(P)H-flavin reductase n=1 Tax=Serpentinicella alkaliphila TaxID=1734049 RepID=A0A4R2TDF8_9FIRM|nr:sulfide/dihydroorotate dehydrogenase-like FAD/NAD-binding protein [Serpentinicella alkaliphila]QUH26569.1 sulfide/dihydroorotate dehydrogenase-like FAD/NAD-binding protein [Serpentinicella alkaliphila]TCP99054.1 NAD(P)H-flavin reductase [Serpentinicella alkaliphila]
MNKEQSYCIDVGSEYCPCYLAETMNCITCSHLQNQKFCNCNWRGTCVYQEFYHCGSKLKESREAIETKILNKETIGNVIVLTIAVPHTLARQLNQPGAYVFVRSKNSNQFFDTPMSIMEADPVKDIIKMAIQIHGVKTKTINNDAEDTILIRGPYWNGVYGIEHLKRTENDKCLFLVRGVAQAPALLVIKHLLSHNNTVDVLLDGGSIKHNFITENHGVNIIGNYNLANEDTQKFIKDLISKENYEIVFIGTTDQLRMKIVKRIPELNNKKIVATNNHEICCGEGICGSCKAYDINGFRIKTCKTQVIL